MNEKLLLLGLLISLLAPQENYAQRANPENLDTKTIIKKLSDERNILLDELRKQGIERRKLMALMAKIRKKEKMLREKEMAIRKQISILRKEEEIELRLQRVGDLQPDSTPLIKGPMKKGDLQKGNLLSVNPSAKVVTISTHNEDSGFANNIYIIGEDAVVLLNKVPVPIASLPQHAKASYWVHPQDASTITWLEVHKN